MRISDIIGEIAITFPTLGILERTIETIINFLEGIISQQSGGFHKSLEHFGSVSVLITYFMLEGWMMFKANSWLTT